MSRRRLRLTCESALRIAEWRLAQQQRRVLAVEARWTPAAPVSTSTARRPSVRKLYALWLGIGLVVLAAILTDWVVGAVATQILLLGYLLASLVAVCGGLTHAYTFEVGIWRGLRLEAFPATPFGPPVVTWALQRVVWHFHTVAWLATAALLAWFSLAYWQPDYAPKVVRLLAVYWLAVVVASFAVNVFSRRAEVSYGALMAAWFQWAIALAMVALMVWGNRMDEIVERAVR